MAASPSDHLAYAHILEKAMRLTTNQLRSHACDTKEEAEKILAQEYDLVMGTDPFCPIVGSWCRQDKCVAFVPGRVINDVVVDFKIGERMIFRALSPYCSAYMLRGAP